MASPNVRRFKSDLTARNFSTIKRSLIAATTLTPARHAGTTCVLNLAAGFTVTLPAATGSGMKYRLINGIAGNAYIVAVTGNDTFVGGVFINDVGDSAAATADFYRPASTDNKITMLTAAGGGAVGDFLEFEDIVADKWAVFGVFQTATDPATPFSTV